MSNVSSQLIANYEQAAYFVLKTNVFDLQPKNIDFAITCKQNNHFVDSLLQKYQLSSWAFITSFGILSLHKIFHWRKTKHKISPCS